MQFFKKIFIATMIVVLGTCVSYAQEGRIGIVDLHKVFEESSAGKSAKAEIKQKGQRMEEDLKKRGGDLEALKTKLEREVMVMSKEKREEKERDFRIKVGDFKALQKKYAEELKEREGELLKQFQNNFFQLTKEIGKKDGYLMIIEKVGVLYYPDSIDLTDKFIKAYDAKFGK